MPNVSRAAERALNQVARARRDPLWPRGDASAAARLKSIESSIRALADVDYDGDRAADAVKLVRWVADWIPDLDDPILKALGDLVDELRKEG